MDVKDIKPIPKYIMDAIYKHDLKIEPWQTNFVRYYAYLTIWKKELIKVTVAVTNLKNKYWACKQVAVHGIHSEYCFVRDMEYNYFGNGFQGRLVCGRTAIAAKAIRGRQVARRPNKIL